MTMSLPATLPTPATTGKAGSSAPGKGIATAPGQHKDATADAAGVADMFAALVATLTAQMQPVANQTTVSTGEVAVEGAPVTVAAPGLTAVLAEAGVDATAVVAADAVPAGVTAAVEEAAPPAAAPVAVDADGAIATAVPTQTGTDADAEAGPGDQPNAAAPATPATPATPANETEGPAAPATPATPGQPAASRAEAAAAALLAPPANAAATDKPDVDRGIATVSATPATPASAATERTVAATPARPAPPADPHVQVARVVRPLRLGNDGTYELALDLTPAELGRVRIDVELRGATISMTLRADNPATRDLLQSSLDQLRSELEAAGLHAGNLDVGGRGASGRGTDEQHTSSAAGTDTGPDVADATPIEPTITAEDTASGVNVLA